MKLDLEGATVGNLAAMWDAEKKIQKRLERKMEVSRDRQEEILKILWREAYSLEDQRQGGGRWSKAKERPTTDDVS